jgi:hypothetical protein
MKVFDVLWMDFLKTLQFMIMSSKKCFGGHLKMCHEILRYSPCDADPIIGARPPPYLIHDDK